MRVLARAALLLAAVLSGCGTTAAEEALANTRRLSLEPCDPATGSFTVEITNDYLPYLPGQQWILDSESERVQVTVLDDTRVVAGVTTRVVEEREWVGDELVEDAGLRHGVPSPGMRRRPGIRRGNAIRTAPAG